MNINTLKLSYDHYYGEIIKAVEHNKTIQARIMAVALPIFAAKTAIHEVTGAIVRIPFAVVQTGLGLCVFILPATTPASRLLLKLMLACPSLWLCITKVNTAVWTLFYGAILTPVAVLTPGQLPKTPSLFRFPSIDGKKNDAVGNAHQKTTKGFQAICGMTELKNNLQEIIWPLVDPAKAQRFGVSLSSGLLLHGAPGNGKSMIAEKFAEEIEQQTGKKVSVRKIKMSEIGSPYLHETSKELQKLVEEQALTASMNGSISILIIDEIDTVIQSGQRQPQHAGFEEERGTFLQILEKAATSGLLIIGTTNYPEKLDPAIIRSGRFDHKFEVKHPDEQSILALMTAFLADRPCAPDLNLPALAKQLASSAAPPSVADVKKIIEGAARRAFAQSMMKKDETIVITSEMIVTEINDHLNQKNLPGQRTAGFRM